MIPDCGFVAPCCKIHIFTYILILSQNSRRMPLCKSTNVGMATANTVERYLQEGLA
jgi:hypothetical protein